jgi:2-polyprenyl-6-hydroxyphenyl methylase/3-demethylubiquinone-9 3-methyltransferase
MRQEQALALVEPGESLLDVGCGRGAVAAALSPRFRRVHGVDGDSEPLAAAAARGVEVSRVDLDREPLPFPDACFDAVVCLEVVEHVRDPLELAREAARVLRPGGNLYLSTPNIRFAGYLRRLVLGGRFPLTSDDPQGWQGGHIHFFTFADVEELLAAGGFHRVRHHGLTPARIRRSPAFRAAERALGERLVREFLTVGIFTVAERAADGLPPRRPAERGLRSA